MFSLCLIVLLISAGVVAQADASSSTLKGTVTDQNGSAIGAATVVVKSTERGVTRTATTDGKGTYRLPFLHPGRYQIQVSSAGFQTQVLTRNRYRGTDCGRDVQLLVGPVQEVVEVGDITTLADVARTHQSETVERSQIATLPNLSRNLTSYIFTLPGVADVSAARVQQTRVAPVPTSGFSVGSGNGRTNYFSIDGGENESGIGSLRVRNMSVEAVQEFQVNRNAFSAEYGFTAGTSVNVITRSGTNDLHGSGYVFYRSQRTAARDPLNTIGIKPFEQRVAPGFTFGGPLIKDRAFFFTSFEALKYDVARLRSYTGNSALLVPTGAQSAYLQFLTSGPYSNDTTRRIAAALAPTLTTTTYPTTMLLLRKSEGQFKVPSRSYNWTTRLDYDRSERDLFSGRFTLSTEDNNLLGPDNVPAPTKCNSRGP
jgi:hypothetical protein